MTSQEAAIGIETRIAASDKRYGPFASTHEAMGVAMEEWRELQDEVHANNLDGVRKEALDMAAALIRLHDSLNNPATRERSVK